MLLPDYGDIKKEDKFWATVLEDSITLMYMKLDHYKFVYGGKYHEGYRPEEDPSSKKISMRPTCNCGIPCDINEYKGKKYWRCCKKNGWEGLDNFLRNYLDFVDLEPCRYYKSYS